MESLNPRSFKSIKKAVSERRAKSRGQLARQLVNSFREPTIQRRAEAVQATKVEANEKVAPKKSTSKPPHKSSNAKKD